MHIEPFERSYTRLFGDNVSTNPDADAFFEAFYEHFLANPKIAGRFANTDMRRQVHMLKLSLFHLAAFYVTCTSSSELDQIADNHRAMGITDQEYDLWLESLINTVRLFDDQCDLETEYCWRWALTPGITYMRMH